MSMPNWCLTTYKCIGEKKEVFKLYKTIKKMDRNGAGEFITKASYRTVNVSIRRNYL